MNFIVAVDEQWNIGKDNDLLFKLSPDLQNFKKLTTGKVVVMGRSTLESLPGGKPLPGRTNIVLTTEPAYTVEGAAIVHTMEELFDGIKKYPPEDVFIIGGASVYNQLMDYCDKAYITKVLATAAADASIHSLDDRDDWKVTEQSEMHEHDGLRFRFTVYENSDPKQL